jgi:Transport and Golgi organisation 2
MCTVTIVPTEHGIRMACNRDESPLRAAALPPRVVTVGQRQALMPIDPVSGGTWIAATDAGLIFTLLNVYTAPRDPQAPTPRVSRGTIIPRLLDAGTLGEALARTNELNADDYAAFRLVLADRQRVADVYCTGGTCQRHPPSDIAGPILFTSSGLGDALVDPPRRALFGEFFGAGQDWRAQQDAYHRHSWPERRHLSVCMWRPEARTMSLTVVEMDSDGVRMDYFAGAPGPLSVAFSARLATRER